MSEVAKAANPPVSVASPKATSSPVAREKVHIKVYSPFKTYFDEEAYSISAENDTGPFDILPKHHNFITLLNPCELVIERDGGPMGIQISKGVMHVKADKIVVFLDV